MQLECPFPGMDPYLESSGYWRDFHSSFISEFRVQLAEILPDNYDAVIDERVALVELPSETATQILPDTAVVLNTGRASTAAAAVTPEIEVQAVTIPLVYAETETESFIQILHHETRKLITVVELLSPTNKSHPGLSDYITKRDAILRQQIHLVELDLLVAGRRMRTARPLPAGDFFAFVSRWEQRPTCDVYAWSIRLAMPKIRIPLQAPDGDVVVSLQHVFAETYRRSRYAKLLDYERPLQTQLSSVDAAWAVSLVTSRR